MTDLSLRQILARSQKVHEYYREHNQTWNPLEQNAHIHAEVSEQWEVLRNKKNRYGITFSKEWIDSLTDETMDIMISALTTLLDLKIPHDKIMESMERTLRKIEDRTWAKQTTITQDGKP